MDPFEVRMQFITHMKRLNASQHSIQKVVGFAVKYFSACGEDIWECIIDECKKGSINSRINILYLLDSLCETCLLLKSRTKAIHPEKKNIGNQYVDYVTRDLGQIVESVVPEGRDGLPNLTSTRQILESWRAKRLIDPQVLDEAVSTLDARKSAVSSSSNPSSSHPQPRQKGLRTEDILRRIEEDRERHKRLRERRWVQPITFFNPSSPFNQQQNQQLCPLTTFQPMTDDGDGDNELSIDIEFNNEWEATSDWNEDDDEAAIEENDLCFPKDPAEKEEPMDLE